LIDSTSQDGVTALDPSLQRERIVVAAGLSVLAILAWIYLWRGAGMGMTALDMTSLVLFPHTQAEPMPGMVMPVVTWFTVTAMWMVMMIAMMVPSAVPLVLLYLRVAHHPIESVKRAPVYVPSAFLVAGYLAIWLAFSMIAATLQFGLQQTGLISEMMLWSRSAVLSATVLAAAGLYQLTSTKRACLKRCRGPANFLTRHWRPGRLGAFVMGLEHGAWCVSCCWVLMGLLFVGGVMNLVWIALIAILILIERVAPFGITVGRFSGGVLLAWSVATLVVG
jgi:predicted metal-binding membrane protein